MPPHGTASIHARRTKCFGCVTILQLSVEYSGQSDHRVKGFGKAGLTGDVAPAAATRAAISVMKIS
jgi:hypothetical protein